MSVHHRNILATCRKGQVDGVSYATFATKNERSDFYCYCFNQGVNAEKCETPVDLGVKSFTLKIDFNAPIDLPTL